METKDNIVYSQIHRLHKGTNEICIPLYENLFREHFICSLGLKFQGDLDTVILKGIALCLD